MNRDDIIRMAREAGLFRHVPPTSHVLLSYDLMVFAALVTAHERDECALLVENCCSYCAERIRERGGKPRETVQCDISVNDITKAALKILDVQLTKQGLKP